MYLCYVDESGNPTLKDQSQHLVLGATAVFEGRWRYLKADLTHLLQSYFPEGEAPPEIHCKEVRFGRGIYARFSLEERIGILRDFGRIIDSYYPHELRLFTVIVEKARWVEQHPNSDVQQMYVDAFEQLVSRIDLFLKRRFREGYPSKGLMIVDPNSSSLSKALKKSLEQYQTTGTRWQDIENVVESVMFLPSHESPGLQVADYCCYAVWRLIESNDDSLIQVIRNRFDREPLESSTAPGKLHGVKYLGSSLEIEQRIFRVWSGTPEFPSEDAGWLAHWQRRARANTAGRKRPAIGRRMKPL